jgi:hypothetical protein
MLFKVWEKPLVGPLIVALSYSARSTITFRESLETAIGLSSTTTKTRRRRRRDLG